LGTRSSCFGQLNVSSTCISVLVMEHTTSHLPCSLLHSMADTSETTNEICFYHPKSSVALIKPHPSLNKAFEPLLQQPLINNRHNSSTINETKWFISTAIKHILSYEVMHSNISVSNFMWSLGLSLSIIVDFEWCMYAVSMGVQVCNYKHFFV